MLVYNGEVYNHPELRAELERERRELRDDLRHRGRPAAAGARRPGRARAAQRPVRVRLVAAGAAPADAGPGPLRGASAPLRAARRRHAWSSAPRPRRCSPPARSSAAPDLAGIDEVFTLWGPAAAADGVSRASTSSRPGGLIVWERGKDRRGPHLVEPDRTGEDSERSDGPRRAAARQRAAAPAGRRAGRHLSLGRPRLEPDHGACAGRDRPPAADVLDRVRRPALRRARPSAGGGARDRHRATTWSRSDRPRSPTAFPEVVWHAEMPLVRTAPVPLFLLAREVREREITVVATGEGADELFWGYELFKEVVLRELARARAGARDRAARAALLLPRAGRRAPRAGLAPLPARDRSRRRAAGLAPHPGRGHRHGQGLLPAEVAAEARRRRLARSPPRRAPAAFAGWSPLERAAWLELATLLEPVPALGAGRPSRDGARRRGPLSVPRPSGVRATLRACPPEEAGRHARQGRAARARGRGPARRDRRARQAALSRPRDRAVLRPAPAWVEERSRRRRWRDRIWDAGGWRGCCGAAAAAARPACARRWR